jgi:hypothetical protein
MTQQVGPITYLRFKLKKQFERWINGLTSVSQKSEGDYSPNINIERVKPMHNIYIDGRRIAKTKGSNNVVIVNGQVIDFDTPEYNEEIRQAFHRGMSSFDTTMREFDRTMSEMFVHDGDIS